MVPGRGAIGCIVKNFSERGALLQLEGQLPARGHFRLVAEAQRVDVICQLRHVGPDGFGVLFVSGSAGAFSEAFKSTDAAGLMPAPIREAKRAEPISSRDLRRAMLGGSA